MSAIGEALRSDAEKILREAREELAEGARREEQLEAELKILAHQQYRLVRLIASIENLARPSEPK